MKWKSQSEQAGEDLALIRSVLDRTRVNIASLAPLFRRLGLVWLVLAALRGCFELGGTAFSAALAGTEPAERAAFLMRNLALRYVTAYGARVMELVLVIVLLVLLLRWRSRIRQMPLDPLSQRLAGSWGVLLAAYILGQLVTGIALPVVFRLLAVSGRLPMSEPEFSTLSSARASLLSACFAVAAVGATGVFLRNRGLLRLALGTLLVFAVRGVLGLVTSWAVSAMETGAAPALMALTSGLYILLSLVPPLTCLLTARILEREGEVSV